MLKISFFVFGLFCSIFLPGDKVGSQVNIFVFTESEVKATKSIARCKINVERPGSKI